jgi:hypothetical protein
MNLNSLNLLRLGAKERENRNIFKKGRRLIKTYHSCHHRQTTTLVPSCSNRTKSLKSILESVSPQIDGKVSLIVITKSRS